MKYISKSLLLLIILFLCCVIAQAQQISDNKREEISPKPELVESYSNFKADEASMIIDLLRKRVVENPGSYGYIIVYCGQICRYGEIEAHLRGISLSLSFKGVPTKRFPVISGGYKAITTTEFWFVPAGAGFPFPDSTVEFKDVKFRRTFKRKIVDYECCFE